MAILKSTEITNLILYSVYKNLGSKNEPNWSETPIHEGLSEQNSIADLLSELGGHIDNFNVTHNEATTVIYNDEIVVDAMEIEGE